MFSAVDIRRPFREIKKHAPLALDRIGASDAAAIVGCSPWNKRSDVIARILAVRAGKKPRDITSPPAYWGTVLEPLVLGTLSSAWKTPIAKPPSVIGPKGRAWARVSPDGVFGDEGVEVKCVSQKNWEEHWLGGQCVPPYYGAQVQYTMEALDAHQWWVAALVGGQYLHTTCVLADPDEQRRIVGACEETWRQMLAQEALEAA